MGRKAETPKRRKAENGTTETLKAETAEPVTESRPTRGLTAVGFRLSVLQSFSVFTRS
jgi:hypothetical protein